MSENAPHSEDEPTQASPAPPPDELSDTADLGGAEPSAGQDAPTTAIPMTTDATTAIPATTDHWTGRAEVRPDAVRDAVPPEDWPAEEQEQEQEQERKWWLPIVIGIIGVLLVLAVIIAAVLLLRRDEEPAPVVTTPVPTTGQVSPTTQPTSSQPSPTQATATAAPSAQIEVPNLAGLTEQAAKTRLEQLGLTYSVTHQEDATSTPGTVIVTVPIGGTVVGPGDTIRLIVATAPPTTEPTQSAEPTATAS
jgi:flagellar basal body-associated protein FliL